MVNFDFNSLISLILKLNKDVEEIKVSNFKVDSKLDKSPLTKADLHVNNHLCEFVKKLIVKILFQKRFQIENLKKEKIGRIIG